MANVQEVQAILRGLNSRLSSLHYSNSVQPEQLLVFSLIPSFPVSEPNEIHPIFALVPSGYCAPQCVFGRVCSDRQADHHLDLLILPPIHRFGAELYRKERSLRELIEHAGGVHTRQLFAIRQPLEQIQYPNRIGIEMLR